VKSWKKIYQANGPQKQAEVAIFILDKVDFKPTLIKLDKERHTPKGNKNYQPICTQCQCTQFHQTYSEGPESIYKLHHSDSGRP
jgi:hypothetical protein